MTRSAFLALALLLAAIPGAAAPPLPTPLLLPAAANPPGLRWLELSSEHFRIIFPEELRDDAGYCADLMEHLRGGLSAGFEAGVGRTTIVLSNQQGTANGYVGFFPRRSEWFHVPPAESLLGSLEWYSLLATHEGRHVAQLAEERRGSVLAAYVLLGELGEAALLLGLGAPSWFLEGDAVLTETLATESGRGRHPGFQRPLRAAALEDDLPTWRQAVFGSYRRGFVNPYELGYLLTARIRRDFGPQAAGEILRGAGRWAAVPGAFERNVRRVTGLSTAELYRTTLAELEESWRAQGEGVPLTPVRPLLADTGGALRDAAEYRYPAGVRGGTVALKASLSQEPALVLIDGEGRERVLRPALAPVGMSAREDRVVWAQLFPDPRWGNRTRTDLVELRLSTGEVRRLTRGRVMQSPAVAAGGARVAAVEVLPQRVSRLVVFGPDGGEEEVHRAAAGAHLQEPAWSPDGRRLYVYETSAAGKGLLELTPREPARATGEGRPAAGWAARRLLPPGRENLEGLDAWGGWVLFGSDRGGPMNVFALDPGTGEVRQVTSRPYGIEGPAVSGDELLFSDGVARGLQPVAMALRPEEWRPAEARPAEARPGRRVDVFRPIVEREGLEPLLDARQVPRRSYEVRPYRPAAEEILPYAWLPVVSADEEGVEEVALVTLSSGMLQDRSLVLLGGWDLRRGGPEAAVELELGRFFPRPVLGAAFEQRDYPGTEEAAQALLGSLGVRLPLSLDGIGWRQGLALEGAWEAGAVWARGRDPLAVQALTGALGWFLSRRTAPRDLAPRWGLALDAVGRAELAGGAADGEGGALSTLPAPGFSATATAWLPGLGRHHSLRFEAVYADDETGSLHPVPRGYAGDPFEEAAVAGASVEYRLPLAYPDAGLGSWLHVPRLTAAAFGDLAWEPAAAAASLRATAGVELAADLEVLVPLPVRVGAQLIWRFEDGRLAFRETLLGLTAVLGR